MQILNSQTDHRGLFTFARSPRDHNVILTITREKIIEFVRDYEIAKRIRLGVMKLSCHEQALLGTVKVAFFAFNLTWFCIDWAFSRGSFKVQSKRRKDMRERHNNGDDKLILKHIDLNWWSIIIIVVNKCLMRRSAIH